MQQERNRKELGKVSDSELERQYRSLQKLINGNKFSKEKRTRLEGEICYIQREQHIRTMRKAAHQKYLEERNKKRRYRN